MIIQKVLWSTQKHLFSSYSNYVFKMSQIIVLSSLFRDQIQNATTALRCVALIAGGECSFIVCQFSSLSAALNVSGSDPGFSGQRKMVVWQLIISWEILPNITPQFIEWENGIRSQFDFSPKGNCCCKQDADYMVEYFASLKLFFSSFSHSCAIKIK